ncbi:SpaH/EbpB family LPXTG-anchored major pilin [Enterococcus viikkiensis]|uniref:SpaH/EbpB family LPXTG-anchored major pilin n=1 Tax=Enterococcus viikkiensis TaxID=930854 RepID=A0ABU3FQM3_9ENTE|nr:SpaH/EbpB family LPXTG-anchored major pilin [Enterococcus viikkiensis]MDT2828287.1 SpaH/EbpB family LPXTG-anchored major pilin [Enterococcus viikkiensis]
MIVTEVGNKKKINLPYDLKVYLGKITEYAKYSIYNENLFFDMNKSGMSQSDLYPNNPSVDVNSKRTRKDSDRDREKMSLGMNSKLTDRNPNLYTQTIYDIFNQEFDIDMNGITENALWLTSYAYEFFFITMVEVELMSGAEKIGNQVRNVNEVTDSFTRLKKGFELLFYPVVLAEGYNDFIGDVTKAYWGSENKLFNIGTSIVTYDGIDAIKESISKLAKSRVSEGFVSFEYGDVVYSGKNNPTDVYDAYPMLATFFVKLFIADAQKLLSKALLSKDKRDKYDFSKNDIRSSEQHGLLKFYLTDFMPIVIDKIQYLLDKSDNSGAGFELYKQINNEIFHYKNNPVVTATVATNMEVTYDYYNQQLVKQTGAGSAEAYNYKVPVPKKEADDTDVDAGQTVKFTITQKIPDDVAQYTEYKLVDNYDARLSLVSTDAQILSSLKIGGATVTDVIPTYSAGANQFTLTFTPSQLAKYAGKPMTFEVNMKVTPGTDLTTIENKITFDNNFYDKHDTEKIKTFGKRFVKEDANTKEKLAGAEFKITNGSGKYLQYLDASNNPIATVTGDKMDSAVAVQWVDSKEMGTTLVSGTDGKFSVFGIASGSYTLIETKAPDGYVTMPDLTFVADDGTQTLSVINKSKEILPSTGGMGIIGLVLLGVITITGAAIYFKKRAGYTEV